MEDSATEAEIRHNGPEAEEVEAERQALLEYAEDNVDSCVFDFTYNIQDHDYIDEFFNRVFLSNDPQNVKVGKCLTELIDDYKVQWAKIHREM